MQQTPPGTRIAPKSKKRAGFAAVVTVLLAVASGGCRVARETVGLPMRAADAIVPSDKPSPPDPAFVQAEIQRFADEYSSRTSEVLDDYARAAGTAEARDRALRWKIAAGSAALGIAGGPNPQANLLDFLALTTVTRMTLENVVTKGADGPAYQPWLDSSKDLEAEAWALAGKSLSPDEQQQVRDAIRKWWQDNSDARDSFFARPQELSTLVRKTASRGSPPGSIFGAVGLDPTAGLDPAVREITRSRLFAERAMFMAERMPFLLRWQVELLADDLLRQGEVVRTVDTADRIGRATESMSKTAAELPDRITAERKAVLAALETQEGKLRELSADITRTLNAGDGMSDSLNATLKTFDALMKRFGVGEPAPPAPPPDPAAPPARPFDILDYAKAAEQITAMTKELNLTIRELNSSLDSPALNARIVAVNGVSDHAAATLRDVVYLVFGLLAALVVLTFACAWVYRARPRATHPTPSGASATI
jgi:hypothetical protein